MLFYIITIRFNSIYDFSMNNDTNFMPYLYSCHFVIYVPVLVAASLFQQCPLSGILCRSRRCIIVSTTSVVRHTMPVPFVASVLSATPSARTPETFRTQLFPSGLHSETHHSRRRTVRSIWRAVLHNADGSCL